MPASRAPSPGPCAQAAEEAATAQRGRANLAAADRQQLRLYSRKCLERVAQAGADPALAAPALKLLYADYQDEGLFDRAIDVLRRLRRIDPRDTTGANNLWQLGWREYGKRNYTGGIGYWTELFSLYPEDASARRGRYWTGRAFDALGETERSQQIYTEIAQADTNDFYRRNALSRVRGSSASAAALAAAAQMRKEPWPVEPGLDRARLLSDLGLDDLALSESELVREKVTPRSLRALEAVILSRHGDRRKSVQVIRDAFPSLGGAFQANVPDEARRLYYPIDFQEAIRTWSALNHLPTYLVCGMIRQESAFDNTAQSWAGARGLMQLMPSTAKELALRNGLTYSHEPAERSIVQRAAGHHLLPAGVHHVRREPGAVARRLQRRSVPHQAAMERGRQRRHRPLPRRPRSRGVEDLRQADPRALGQLPPALSSGRVRPGSLRPSFPALLLGGLLLASCRGAKPAEPGGGPPIVLITFDSLRADVVGGLGGEPGLTPNLDALLRGADWGGRAIAPSSLGASSMASLFTGLRPWQHQVLHDRQAHLAKALLTLPEALKAAGYATAGFSGEASYSRDFGYDQGFDQLETLEKGTGALARLKALRGRQFVWIHIPEPAAPYLRRPNFEDRIDLKGLDLPARVQPNELAPYFDPAMPLPPARRRLFWAMYRLNAAFADDRLGHFLQALRESGQWDRTLLLVTSTHGEELGEKHQILNGGNLGRQLLEVPLAVKLPAGARLRIATPKNRAAGRGADLGHPGGSGGRRGAARGGAEPFPYPSRRPGRRALGALLHRRHEPVLPAGRRRSAPAGVALRVTAARVLPRPPGGDGARQRRGRPRAPLRAAGGDLRPSPRRLPFHAAVHRPGPAEAHPGAVGTGFAEHAGLGPAQDGRAGPVVVSEVERIPSRRDDAGSRGP